MLPSNNDFGIGIDRETSDTVGGTTPQARNIISGNVNFGVGIESDGITLTGHLVQGNYIGTDLTGTTAVGNRDGVALAFARGIMVGGAIPAARNIISGNRGDGINIRGDGFIFLINCGPVVLGPVPNSDIVVQENFIGTDFSGTQPLGNGGDGVRIDRNGFSHDIRSNRIAFNGRSGISIPELNSSLELPAFSVRIVDNSIFSNGALGVDLGADGTTTNDPSDVDAGANLRQNFPELLSAATVIASRATDRFRRRKHNRPGTFNSTPNSTFTLQFSSAAAACIGPPVRRDHANSAQPTTGLYKQQWQCSVYVYIRLSSAVPGILSVPDHGLGRVTSSFRLYRSSQSQHSQNQWRVQGGGKELIVSGAGFVDGAKVFINGEREKKTGFICLLSHSVQGRYARLPAMAVINPTVRERRSLVIHRWPARRGICDSSPPWLRQVSSPCPSVLRSGK
jgi:hypothetical protein